MAPDGVPAGVAAGVAAGHPATVAAGIEILDEGGTAADAAVAASLASCVAETLMTGLLGGGHAIYIDGEEEPLRRDRRADEAPIFSTTGACDEPQVFEAVEQASDVGYAADHAVPDFVPAEPGLAGASQDAQNVVLRR